jgi:hypothetical protein
VIEGPASISAPELKALVFKAGGHEGHESCGLVELGHPKRRGANGQLSELRDRRLVRVTARQRTCYDITDNAFRLKHVTNGSNVFVNESLTAEQRQIKAEILKSSAFQSERQQAAANNQAVRWRAGMPYLAPRNTPSSAPLVPMEVAKPYLPQLPSSGHPSPFAAGFYAAVAAVPAATTVGAVAADGAPTLPADLEEAIPATQ